MEEQDRLLIQTLIGLGFAIPQQVLTIGQLQEEHMIAIMLQFLEKMGMDRVEVSALRSLKGSKFRQASKIQENCQSRYGILFQAQSLLNPNLNDSRKLIVNCLSKLSSSMEEEKSKNIQQELTLDERVKKERQNRYQKLMDTFVQDSWINPTLINYAQNDQRFLKLHLNNILQKEVILKQVANRGLRKYLYNSINAHLKQEDPPRKGDPWVKYEDIQEKLKIIKKMRRQADPDAFLAQVQLQNQERPTEFEGQDWVNYQKGGRVMQKAVKQMKEEDQEIQIQRKEVEQENKNMFALELQFQQEEEIQEANEAKPSVSGDIESELRALRKSNRDEIEAFQAQIQKLEKRLETYTIKRQELEDQIQQKQDRIAIAKEATTQAQKEMQNQHQVLQQIQKKTSENEYQAEIQKLMDENEQIQQDWFTEKIKIQGEIQEIRTKGQEKKDRLLQLMEKLKRLEEENQAIKLEGRKNLEKKDALVQEFQNMPKETQRLTFVKKTNDLGQHQKKSKEEMGKTKSEIIQLEDQITLQNQYIDRYCIELENLFKTDPKRKETIVAQIVQKYEEYKQVYKDTVYFIKEISKIKIEVQEIEQKIDQIIGKGYKQSVDKMKADLNQIKQENAQMK